MGNTKRVFNDNQILTVHNLYVKFVLTEAYQITFSKKYPLLLCENFSRSAVNTNRFRVPRVYYIDNKNNLYNYAPKLWNIIFSCNEFPKEFTSLKSFKNIVNKFILTYQTHGHLTSWEPSNINIENYVASLR